MSDLDLFADVGARKLVSSDGGAVTLPALVLGDTLRCSLRTLERIEDALREKQLKVRALLASIGKVLEPPTSGTFALTLEGFDTAVIAFNADAAVFTTALQGSNIIAQVESPAPSTWVVKTTRAESESEAALEVLTNALAPVSFVRLRQFVQLGVWWFECRLIQAPLAWNEDGYERVLPPPPSITRIRAGRAETVTEPPLNELQDLLLPRDFRGTYFLRWNYRVSRVLGIEDGPDEIAAALDAMFADGGRRFEVSNPEADHAFIEFTGSLAGAPQPLITVEVHSFEPGVLTFTLPLDRAEMAAALRATIEVTVPFEVEVEVVNDDEDPGNPAIPGRLITLFQEPVKIVREQIWKELATVQHIDWLRPPSPRNYLPFTPDQVITGQQSYTAVFGNGVATSFSFAHNLGTDNISGLIVRENMSGGRVLTVNAEFEATMPSANELVLTFAAAPATNSLVLILTTAGPISAFLAHTHTMAQIVGLLDALNDLGGRVTAIEERLPFTIPSVRENTTSKTETFTLDDRFDMFPGWFPDGTDYSKAAPPNRPGALLPAIHDATIDALTVPLVAASGQTGKVFQNQTGSPVLVPGGLGRRGRYLQPNEYAGSDGRIWYALMRDGSTNSFSPADFERELFLLPVHERMFRPGDSLSIEWELELQLFKATTRVQYLLAIEVGSVPQQSTPAPVGVNLSDVTWNATPIFSQRLIIGAQKVKQSCGVAVSRSIANEFATDAMIDGAWEAGAVAPTSANFVLRARLHQFDTENSVTNARGTIRFGFANAQGSITHA